MTHHGSVFFFNILKKSRQDFSMQRIVEKQINIKIYVTYGK